MNTHVTGYHDTIGSQRHSEYGPNGLPHFWKTKQIKWKKQFLGGVSLVSELRFKDPTTGINFYGITEDWRSYLHSDLFRSGNIDISAVLLDDREECSIGTISHGRGSLSVYGSPQGEEMSEGRPEQRFRCNNLSVHPCFVARLSWIR